MSARCTMEIGIFRAVGRVRPFATFDVILAPVIAEHRLLAQQGALTGDEIEVVDPYRRDERSRADPELG